MRHSMVLISVFFAMLGASFAAPATGTTAASSHLQPQFMPRYFEANRGQWPAGQAFRAYGYGYGISLGTSGFTLQVADSKNAKLPGKMIPTTTQGGKASDGTLPREVSLRFEGASSVARLTGQGELGAKGAWFQGSESAWRSGIPLYERVRLDDIYPGTGATFYGRDGQLEYDLVFTCNN